MFFADDMIHLAAPKAVVLMNQAILAAPRGTGGNFAAKGGTNAGLTHD